MNRLNNTIVKISLVLLMMIAPGFKKVINAEEKEVEYGQIFYVGDNLKLSTAAHVVYDDKNDDALLIKAGSYTVPTITSANFLDASGQWEIKEFLQTETGLPDVSLYIGYGVLIDKSNAPIGIKCSSGEGTEDNPYRFEPVYDSKINEVTITVTSPEVGQDTTATPAVTSVFGANYYPGDKNWCDENGNPLTGTVTFESGKNYYIKVKLIAREGYYWNQVPGEGVEVTVNGADKTDKNNFVNSTEGSYAEIVVRVTPRAASQELKNVNISITVPKIGDEVTAEVDPSDPEFYRMDTQKPIPEISVDNCRVQEDVVDPATGQTRKIAFWMTEDRRPFAGKFEANKKYVVNAVLIPDEGYQFASQDTIKVTVNGKELSTSDYRVMKETLTNNSVMMLFAGITPEEPKWIFNGFIWNNDNTAIANYVREDDDSITKTVTDVVVDDSDPKKLVATVSAEDSLDGKENTGEIFKVFNLYVQGNLVTGENCDDILGDGKVSFDPETSELSLNNATIESTKRDFGDDGFEYGIRSYLNNKLNKTGSVNLNNPLVIKLSGENSIINGVDENGEQAYGIYAAYVGGGDFVIEGDGTLNIKFGCSGKVSRGIHYNSGTLVLDASKINVDITGNGDINSLHVANLSVKSGEVNVHAAEGIAVFANNIEVKYGAILEMICDNNRASYDNLTDETKQLGAFVNTDPTEQGATQWDKTTALTAYKYVRIPGSWVLTVKWSSIDGDDQMEEIKVLAAPGITIADACKSAKLFEKEGYKAFGVFLDKSMSNYTNEMDMSEADLSGKTVDDDMTLYYPMIKEIKSVDLTMNPIKSGTHTSTPKNGDEWDYAKQTNRPDITNSSKEYSLVDEATIWVENFEDEPLTPYIGKFDEGTYKGVTIVIPNFGYAMADDVKYNIDGATFVKNDNLILYFTATVDAEYQNIKGDGNVWVKGSAEGSEFIFKRSDNDNETFGNFVGIKVDGKDVDEKDYTAVEGSVVINLKPAYLETLSVGKHTLTAIFEDGQSESTFTIVEKSTPQSRTYVTPKTGVE